MLAIAWHYLTGQAVATDPSDRQRAEWPPHPDRVMQAMVAGWGEAGCDAAQAATLEWLMALPPPELACPLDLPSAKPVKTFVPVNDLEGPRSGSYSETNLNLLPSQRLRKERYFPSVHVGGEVCAMLWPDIEAGPHRESLDRLCAQTTHIGHSRSLVRMWQTDTPPGPVLRPNDLRADFRLRVSDAQRLRQLVVAFAGGGPGWRRPPPGRWQAYERLVCNPSANRGEFDERMLILRRVGGARLGAADAPAAVAALRGLLIEASDQLPLAKRLASGHEPDGTPLRETHVAVVALPFVADPTLEGGGAFADGHLLGFGIVLPRCLEPDAEQQLLLSVAGAFRKVGGGTRRLALGPKGALDIAFSGQEAPPRSLRGETWTAAARHWGSVTPIALDRSPPRRHEDTDGWAVAQLAETFRRQGLPSPASVELLPVSPFIGAPGAREFPALPRKDGTRRWHLHARFGFEHQIAGPLVVGAGRYRGYGLLRPLREST